MPSSFIEYVCFIALALLAGLYFYKTIPVTEVEGKSTQLSSANEYSVKASTPIIEDQELKLYKDLYFKLHNLETNLDVLPRARRQLLSFFCSSLNAERKSSTQSGLRSILGIEKYERIALEEFLKSEHDDTLNQCQDYLASTASEKSRSFLGTREEAVRWILNNAPLKYVDGAWLGGVQRLTEATPFAYRSVTKDAWQVLSEELGDGEVARNHVFVYRDLLRSVGINLPAANDKAFVTEELGMDDICAWRAAVGQLLISLFPDDFLPEMLGFNLHFEQLTLETSQAAHRLPELGITGYYFILHICIDNAHSGHAAMALDTISQYLDMVRSSDGEEAAQVAWKRVQSGYILSKQVGSHDIDNNDVSSSFPLLSEQEAYIARMFQLKAEVSQPLHCCSRVKIGGKSLSDWLSHSNLQSPHGQARLLDALGKASPWVRKGNSSGSLLIRELEWGGKMFGAFMDKEVEQIKDWINNLGMPKDVDDQKYWSVLGIGSSYAGSRGRSPFHQQQEIFRSPPRPLAGNMFIPQPPLLSSTSNVCLPSLLPLWFAHACLLQCMVSVPYRTISPIGSLVVRLLRAEYGFSPDPDVVAGIEEHSSQGVSLIDLGLELTQRYHLAKSGGFDKLQLPQPRCLGDMLDYKPMEDENSGSRARAFAGKMLQWSRSPVANETTLLGLARAFFDLEVWVANVQGLLSEDGRQSLRDIVERKAILLDNCVAQLTKEARLGEFAVGYESGREEIKYCFRDL
ncbi:hypothetical protein F4805DRAFT_477105 [Annulohypoxylon moriforme]|nr:hypothetical protein F4805DRAFT_477105 [Annulohypoxylon moriforme]